MKNKGFTLIEIMLAMSILLIISAPISMLIYSMYNSYNVENQNIIAQDMARKAMTVIMDDLRKNGSNVTKVEDNGRKLNLDGNIIYSLDYNVYNKSNKLFKNVGASQTLILDTEQDSPVITFEKIDGTVNDIIKVKINLKYKKSLKVEMENIYTIKVELD